MDVLYPKGAGLDVHLQTVVACVRIGADKTVADEVRTFGTTTQELLALSDWLSAHGWPHVAMESSGVYWKPVGHILEGHFELVLANAMHIRNIPGRKSAVNDATWIADLLAHGLIRDSFGPPPPVQEARSHPHPPMSWASAAARSSGPSSRASAIPTAWPPWPTSASQPRRLTSPPPCAAV